MTAKHTSTTATASVDTIPEKTETLEDRFKLTESNLRNWLFGSYEKARRPLIEARKRMRDEGISEKLIGHNLYYEETVQERVDKEMMKLVTDRNGRFHSIPKLLETGRVTPAEIDSIRAFHNNREPPYY